jgi:hypothetical protein
VTAPQVQSKDLSEYYSYVRRIPSRNHCDKLFQFFFVHLNPLCSPLDETIFREQIQRWWGLAHSLLIKEGPNGLPEEIRCFPAVIFQLLAITLQFVSDSFTAEIDDLRFGPFQTVAELSKEYSECGVALSDMVGNAKLTLIGVQHSSMRDWWLLNSGDLVQAWTSSGQTVRYKSTLTLPFRILTRLFQEMPWLLDYTVNLKFLRRVMQSSFLIVCGRTRCENAPGSTFLSLTCE